MEHEHTSAPSHNGFQCLIDLSDFFFMVLGVAEVSLYLFIRVLSERLELIASYLVEELFITYQLECSLSIALLNGAIGKSSTGGFEVKQKDQRSTVKLIAKIHILDLSQQ
jgi:hypothetical protein